MITKCAVLAAVCAVVGAASGDVFNMGPGLTSLEVVRVGNPGNADDTHGAGYGGVDYVYNIGKYEVTAGQYAEFLNSVAGVDAYGLYSASMSSGYGCRIERFAGSGTGGDPYQYRVAGYLGVADISFTLIP